MLSAFPLSLIWPTLTVWLDDMKRFLSFIAFVLTITLTASGETLPPEVDVTTGLGGEGSVRIAVEQFTPPPEGVTHLIPEVGDRELQNTKEVCDKKAGISAAFAAGREPTEAQYWRFDGCQRWFNARQGIGVGW